MHAAINSSTGYSMFAWKLRREVKKGLPLPVPLGFRPLWMSQLRSVECFITQPCSSSIFTVQCLLGLHHPLSRTWRPRVAPLVFCPLPLLLLELLACGACELILACQIGPRWPKHAQAKSIHVHLSKLGIRWHLTLLINEGSSRDSVMQIGYPCSVFFSSLTAQCSLTVVIVVCMVHLAAPRRSPWE